MEIFLILLIVLLLFGARRLPELSRSMGKSLREFKKATSDVEDDFRNAMNEDPSKEKKSSAGSAKTDSEKTSGGEPAKIDSEKSLGEESRNKASV